MLKLEVGPPPNAIIEKFADGTVARVMIPVELTPGEPFTLMDEKLLYKRWGIDEDDRAQAQWIEYWLEVPDASRPDVKPVHRSATVFGKKPLSMGGETGKISA